MTSVAEILMRFWIVGDEQVRDVIGDFGNEGLRLDGGKGFQFCGDEIGALLVFGFERSVILAEEPIDGSDETNDFFLGDFHAAADGVGVRGIVLFRGVDEIFAAEEQAGALWTAKALAAGESDEIETHLSVVPEIGDRGNIGSGIVEAGDAVLVSDANPVFAGDFATFRGVEEMGHYGFVVEGFFVFVHGFNFDIANAAIAESVVVIVAVGFLDDDFVFEAGHIGGDADDGGFVAEGDAGSGADGECAGGTGSDESASTFQAFGKIRAGGILEFEEIDWV